jgi:hypothetical protein
MHGERGRFQGRGMRRSRADLGVGRGCGSRARDGGGGTQLWTPFRHRRRLALVKGTKDPRHGGVDPRRQLRFSGEAAVAIQWGRSAEDGGRGGGGGCGAARAREWRIGAILGHGNGGSTRSWGSGGGARVEQRVTCDRAQARGAVRGRARARGGEGGGMWTPSLGT